MIMIKCRKVLNILNEIVVMQTQDKGHYRSNRPCGWVSHCIPPATICSLEDDSADEGGKSPYTTSDTSILEGGARGRAGARSGSGSGDSGRTTGRIASICGGERVSMCRTRG